MKFTITIESNDPVFTGAGEGWPERAVAALVRNVAAELDAGWSGPRDIRKVAKLVRLASKETEATPGEVVGKWEYTRGVTK